MYVGNYIRDIHGTVFPLNPFERELFYRDDLHQWYQYNGTAWIAIGPGMMVHGNAWHAPAFATQADLLAHVGATAVGTHGSDVLATPDRLVHRDGAGRAQIVNPIANPDIDNLASRNAAIAVEAAARVAADAAHAAQTAVGVHGSAVLATPNLLVHRDGAGRSQIVNPTVAAEIDNLGSRDAAIAAHAAATSGVHGVGTGRIAKISIADKTIYLDKNASGNNDGTSWADAFESWADCKAFLTGYTIAHNWVIKVRKGTTPYRETFSLVGFTVWGTLTIEAEYYWQNNCEANAVAGDVVDAGAFTNVVIGDKVFVLNLNGANGRAIDYELCTVDSIAGAPDRIGTNGIKTATTGWKYTIVRTEISGSNNGTDGGTVRDYCAQITSIDNIILKGFYLTFSDSVAIYFRNSRNSYVYDCILDETDGGIMSEAYSNVRVYYSYVEATSLLASIWASEMGYMDARYCALTAPSLYAVYSARVSGLLFYYSYIFSSVNGVRAIDLSLVDIGRCTIANTVTTGIYARHNSCCETLQITNNAVTPVDPVGTTEGACIVPL